MGKCPVKPIITKFGSGLVDVITCANFGIEKLRGLDFTRVQVLFTIINPIEMTGHPYDRFRDCVIRKLHISNHII